ncbi:hypothetical protein ACTHQY_08945 [Rhodococcoides corynebacterioides]|uniref:hypothetical protein n=1 Tax=Rhodococcoides corynebacterioides TaxID=53972 RepID=UPI003F7EDB2B
MNGGETVRVRPGVVLDAEQNPVTQPGVGFSIPGCVIEPLGNAEETGEFGRNGTVTRIKIYAPGPSTQPIRPTDVVDARGHTWDIDGDVEQWEDGDPSLTGPVITASRSAG